MIRIRSRDDVLELLRKGSPEEEAYIARRISKRLATILLTSMPNLKRLYAPRSVINVSSEEVLQALERIGIQVIPTGRRRGRPPKYGAETLKLLLEKYRNGESPSEISRDLGIPLRTVFHLLRKLGLRSEAR